MFREAFKKFVVENRKMAQENDPLVSVGGAKKRRKRVIQSRRKRTHRRAKKIKSRRKRTRRAKK